MTIWQHMGGQVAEETNTGEKCNMVELRLAGSKLR